MEKLPVGKMKPEYKEWLKINKDECYWYSRLTKIYQLLFSWQNNDTNTDKRYNSKEERLEEVKHLRESLFDPEIEKEFESWLELSNEELHQKYDYFCEKYNEACNIADNGWK